MFGPWILRSSDGLSLVWVVTFSPHRYLLKKGVQTIIQYGKLAKKRLVLVQINLLDQKLSVFKTKIQVQIRVKNVSLRVINDERKWNYERTKLSPGQLVPFLDFRSV